MVCQKGKIEKTVTKEDLSRAIASLREAGIGSKFLVTTYGR